MNPQVGVSRHPGNAAKASRLTVEIDSLVDETQYLLSSPAAPASAPAPKQAKGSKKRAASTTPPAPSQDKKPKIKEDAKVGDGQNAKSKQIAIPIDEYCPLRSYQVFMVSDGTIYDASLNQTNAGANNSKQRPRTSFV